MIPKTRWRRLATGFASAVRVDPRAEVSRRNLDVVLRSFLSRVAYLIFLDAFVVSRLTTDSGQEAIRWLAVAALLSGAVRPRGRVGVIVSGGNVDASVMAGILRGESLVGASV